MDFETNLPDWENNGTEPSETLKTEGFKEGYKPPAGIFNWFWNKVTAGIKELQTKASEIADTLTNKVDKSTGLGLMGFGTSSSGGKVNDTILMIDSSAGTPTVKTLVKYLSDLSLDLYNVAATSTDGEYYNATVKGITELFAGLTITIIPDTTSTTTLPKLNLNSLGAKNIKQSLTSSNSLTVQADSVGWIVADKPLTLMYDGSVWKTILPRANANDLYGTVDIEHGGTGGTTVYSALLNLGKADGTYNGNGSTDKRIIETGGIGQAVLIERNTGGIAILTKKGAIICSNSTFEVSFLTSSNCMWNEDSYISLWTDNEFLNASGKTYTYKVL